jgi:arylsulfatase A-like enzyme
VSHKSPSRRDILRIGAASLTTPLLTACNPKTSAAAIDKPNVIIFLSDTLRADHLQPYGYPRQNSPEIQKFSREAINLRKMSSAATWTKPSIATIMTGASPQLHKMVVYKPNEDGPQQGLRVLSQSLPTFDQFYKEAGYNTAWFLSNPHVVQDLGFGKSYDHYRSIPEESVEDQMKAVITWLENNAQEPFLAFVHVLDPHYPYLCDDEQFAQLHGRTVLQSLEQLPQKDADILYDFHLKDFKERGGRMIEELEGISPAAIQHIKNLYDTEIMRVDQQFGKMITTLQKKDLYDKTLLILTSDHGESFKEHGKFYHGNHLFDTEIHVPFLMRLPWAKKHIELDWPIDQASLCPSLLALLGIQPTQHMQAPPFLTPQGTLTQPNQNKSLAYLDFYSNTPETWHAGLIDWPYKMIYQPTQDTYRVYNRNADPGENNNLAKDTTKWSRKMKDMANTLRAQREKEMHLATNLAPAEYTVLEDQDAIVEALGAIGYMDPDVDEQEDESPKKKNPQDKDE